MKIYITDQGQIFGEHPEWRFPKEYSLTSEVNARSHAILFEDHWGVIDRLPFKCFIELKKIMTGGGPLTKSYKLVPGIYTVDLPEVERVEQIETPNGKWIDLEEGFKFESLPHRYIYRFVGRKEEVYEGMKYFEVYCLNFSKIIHSDSLFSAVLKFIKEHPFERVILAEDTVLFHLAKELTPSESQEELHEMIAKVHEDIEGRYELDSYDKGIIHYLLCQLQTRKP